MNREEYERLARVEHDHWWFRGLRDLFARLLRSPRTRPSATDDVLDAGCGTGANLRFLHDLLHPATLAGFDRSPAAVAWAARKAPEADVYESDLCAPELRQPAIDVALCSDVIYATGAAESLPGLRAIAERLRSGGVLLLHVPAYQWLYSDHDAAVHTRERYTVRQVRALLGSLGLSIECLSYRVCLLFPLVVLARLPSLLRRRRGDGGAVSDLVLPPRWINAGLERLLRLENWCLERGLRCPFGSSIVAVARKA
jgi:SAM-dependent methyltransferase